MSPARPLEIGFALAFCLALAGCTTVPDAAKARSDSKPAAAEVGKSRASADPVEAVLGRVAEARAGMDGAWDGVAREVLRVDFPAEGFERVLAAAGGREERLLEALLGRAKFLSDDVSAALRRAGQAVGESGRWTAWRAAVREISGRECCLTRRFLAAALDGLADGLERAGVAMQNEPETALRLMELAEHSDPGVAGAAGRVRKYFPLAAR